MGIAQVKISTARELVRRGFYPADPSDPNISPQNINKASGRYLNDYISNPKHSIYFAAAKLKQIENDFSSKNNLFQPEAIADLYSRGNEGVKTGRNPDLDPLMLEN